MKVQCRIQAPAPIAVGTGAFIKPIIEYKMNIISRYIKLDFCRYSENSLILLENIRNMEKITTRQLVFVLLGIILVIPFILTFPAICSRLNFNVTGQIGDTIGGLTAPFIASIGAILVFIAFREQVRANAEQARVNLEQARVNDQIRNLEKTKIVIDSINWLRSDSFQITRTSQTFIAEFNGDNMCYEQLNKGSYLMYEFKNTFNYADGNITAGKEELKSKIGVLYRVMFQIDLEKMLVPCVAYDRDGGRDTIVLEFIGICQELSVLLRGH